MFSKSVSGVNQSEPELHQALKNAAPLARYLEKNASSADAADIFQESIARVLEQARQKPEEMVGAHGSILKRQSVTPFDLTPRSACTRPDGRAGHIFF